jgi:hypothetical protein
VSRHDLKTLQHGAVARRRQVAESVAHKAFEAGNAMPDQRLEPVDIMLVEEAVYAVIDIRLPRGRGLFELQRLDRSRRRISIRHLEHRGDAPDRGRRCSGAPILLVCVAGLTEMHMAVDCPRQYVTPCRLDHLFGALGGEPFAEGDDRLTDNADIGLDHAVGRNDPGIRDHQIKRGHSPSLASGDCSCTPRRYSQVCRDFTLRTLARRGYFRTQLRFAIRGRTVLAGSKRSLPFRGVAGNGAWKVVKLSVRRRQERSLLARPAAAARRSVVGASTGPCCGCAGCR